MRKVDKLACLVFRFRVKKMLIQFMFFGSRDRFKYRFKISELRRNSAFFVESKVAAKRAYKISVRYDRLKVYKQRLKISSFNKKRGFGLSR